MRGEYLYPKRHAQPIQGSPPHARGIPDEEFAKLPPVGITPACAGNTLREQIILAFNRDHPRMRGEYLHHLVQAHHELGSPPHARGILCKP